VEKTMSATVTVFGLGYVGSVMSACVASFGHRVIGVDSNPSKVEALNAGRTPIVEPGMVENLAQARASGYLEATSDSAAAIARSDISFICVGTPCLPNGKLDLRSVEHVCKDIGKALRQHSGRHTVVVRSTVLPGTTESIVIPCLESSSGLRSGVDFYVCVNPEFLREGTDLRDFIDPPMTVLGAAEPDHLEPLRRLYAGVSGPTFETSFRVAEMVKYACNSFHAVKVAFANEVGRLAAGMGADADRVAEIFCADTRLNISPAYLKPGFAFGGSCLPKDLRALTYRANELDLQVPLLDSVLPSNREHIECAVEAVLATGKKNIALLGLSFKAGTDDLRESPFVQLIKRLLGEGRHLQIWDDNVSLGRLIGSNRRYIDDVIPHIGALLCDTVEQAVRDAGVVVVGSKVVEKSALQKLLRPEQMVIDLSSVSCAHSDGNL
jgi:GDP-mannose 6-dehydrogenase